MAVNDRISYEFIERALRNSRNICDYCGYEFDHENRKYKKVLRVRADIPDYVVHNIRVVCHWCYLGAMAHMEAWAGLGKG